MTDGVLNYLRQAGET